MGDLNLEQTLTNIGAFEAATIKEITDQHTVFSRANRTLTTIIGGENETDGGATIRNLAKLIEYYADDEGKFDNLEETQKDRILEKT